MHKPTEKRSVSKRTKRLFIGFGAMGIAAVSLVYYVYPNVWQPSQTQAAPAPVAQRSVK